MVKEVRPAMKIIGAITESDFGREPHSEKWQAYRIREAARAILLDNNARIALMHVASDNYYKLPGGGIDEGEDVTTALSRELLEEVGASAVEVISEVGQVDEYRDEYEANGRHYCFVAKLTGPIVEPARTEKELAEGYETVWASNVDEAIILVEQGTPKDYGHNFERLRELAFLNEAKSLLKNH